MQAAGAHAMCVWCVCVIELRQLFSVVWCLNEIPEEIFRVCEDLLAEQMVGAPKRF